MTRPDDSNEDKIMTLGRPMPETEAKIVDPQSGETVACGVLGEFCTRGYHIMHCYFEMDDATANAIDDEGWLHTGDLCSMDERGYSKIEGRLKDVIIRGGENIYPREIEEFLYTHPDIEDAQVIGVPSEKYGEEVMAWIKTKGGKALTDEELGAFCKGEIATFKIPRFWKSVDEFPMTVTGKIQKYRMREVAIAELGLTEQETA